MKKSNAKKRDSSQQVGADRRNSGDTASIRNKKLASYLEDDACDEAFEMSLIKPTWEAGDVVEVAWKGKGFEGSWAEADVVRVDGGKQMRLRRQALKA